ncbi:hypothetical protein C8J56DRAFT_798958 [Mycena floridula]|nr:hypothetical protein C8J56DRAFT_798958 [Mycena floridula]
MFQLNVLSSILVFASDFLLFLLANISAALIASAIAQFRHPFPFFHRRHQTRLSTVEIMPPDVWADLDAEAKAVFNPRDWIGRGQQYKDAPLHIINARLLAMQLPSTALARLPSPNLSVKEFIAWKLPKKSYSYNSFPTKVYFSHNTPNRNDTEAFVILCSRPIPATHILNAMDDECGQQWTDGTKSILDPRYSKAGDRFPLWALTLWKRMRFLIDSQENWIDAYKAVDKWIQTSSSLSDDFPTVESILRCRGWNSEVNHGNFSFTTQKFTQILQQKQLCDDVSQSMIHKLQMRLDSERDQYPHQMIAASRLHSVLEIAAEKKKYKDTNLPTSLGIIEEAVKQDPKLKVWFAALLAGHEVAFCIDFEKRSLAFGDTIPTYPEPKKILKNTQSWLRARFKGPFTDLGNTLKHGVQKDSISCIPGAMNTIAVGVFGDDLWNHENRFLDRVRWFTSLVPPTDEAQNDQAAPPEPVVHPSLQNLLNDVSPPATVHPELKNLLNATDDIAFDDIFASFYDEDQPDAPEDPSPSNTDSPDTPKTASRDEPPSMDVDYDASSATSQAQPSTTKKAKGSGETSFGPVGLSKAARSEKASRAAADAGKVDEAARQKWKAGILAVDAHAEFDENNLRQVRCSNCSKWHKAKAANDFSRINEHYKECLLKERHKKKSRAKTSRTSTLLSHWTSAIRLRQKNEKPLPCPGLSEPDEIRIPQYLRRTAVGGGGARSITVIADERFSRLFSRLSRDEKKEVLDTQIHEHKWKNDHQHIRVFSTDCGGHASGQSEDEKRRRLPCGSCRELLKLHTFQNALSKPTRDDDNYKFINKHFRNELMGEHFAKVKGLKKLFDSADDKNSPFLRFAMGAVMGDYDDYDVFLGLVHAMVRKVDKEKRGVGMQNFDYAPAWDEFINIVHVHSPRAHQFLAKHFPARTTRSIRVQQAKQSKTPITICPESFTRVKQQLDALDYSGPVAVACDDTKLLSGLRLYWDVTKKGHYLVGGADGPILVPDPEEMEALMNDPSIPKGTKLRIWTAQVPLPKMTPMIVAAIPITNTLKAPDLLPMLESVIFGLLDNDIKVISYACDGTETERLVQRLFSAKADTHIDVKIENPREGMSDLDIKIPVFRGQPIAMVQDSKHGLKTFRNNLFSGARLLVLGNHVALFQQVYDMAFERGTPLYHRDVEKLDRQDDNAAARLFSAPTLQYLADKHPDDVGLIVYLFIFGELCDAYQNRSIQHDERLNILLRARYFLDMWQKYIDTAPGYQKSHYFMSRESVDIISFLINACEHIFGLARQIIKDFTMVDFWNSVPKITVRLREALFRSKMSTKSEMKARAAGYNHTYLDTHNIDLLALATFPSLSMFPRIAEQAADEADSLIALVGIIPSFVHAPNNVTTTLPSIESWFYDTEADLDLRDEDDISICGEAEILQELIKENDEAPQTDRLDALTSAAIALSVEEQIHLRSLPEATDEMLDEYLADDQRNLLELQDDRRSKHSRLADIDMDEELRPIGFGAETVDYTELSLDVLVSLREKHQTQHAAHSVRTRSSADKASLDESESLRRKIIRSYYDNLKSGQNRGVTTGEGRNTRWTKNIPELLAKGARGDDAPTLSNGNSSNAEVVASANVKKLSTTRRNIFLKVALSSYQSVAEARVSTLSPIKPGTYGFIYAEKAIMLAQVIALYSKGTGGKSAKHAAITTSTNICALSHLVVRVFEHIHDKDFRNFPSTTNPFQTKGFALLTPASFLTVLGGTAPRTGPTSIQISPADYKVYQVLRKDHSKFTQAMKLFRKRKQDDVEAEEE